MRKILDPNPLVSIVVTTKNEEANIEICLKSIQLQTYKNIEVIVIDNFSCDQTQILAKKYTKLVFEKGPERAAQRNYGMIFCAQGIYVMYVDADMILSPNLVSACVRHMLDKDYVALHISEVVLGTNFFSRVRAFERSFYDGTPIDGARLFEKKIFEKIGGFDEKLFREGSGEDWDIDKKIKKEGVIGMLPKAVPTKQDFNWDLLEFIKSRGVNPAFEYCGIYHNESNFMLSAYLKKKAYYTKGFHGYIKKWGKNDPDVAKQFGIVYRYFIVFTEHGKWKKLIARVDLAFGMYFLRFLVGVIYLASKAKLKN